MCSVHAVFLHYSPDPRPQVCQAKCMKCGAFGHMNIDKRCPLYGKAVDADAPLPSRDSDKLITEMRQVGPRKLEMFLGETCLYLQLKWQKGHNSQVKLS